MTTIKTSYHDFDLCQEFVDKCLPELLDMEILNAHGSEDMWYSGIEEAKIRNFEMSFSLLVDHVRLENLERFEEILNSFGYRMIRHTFAKHDLVIYFEPIVQ